MQAVTPVPRELDQAWEELLRFAETRPRLTYEELDALTLTELRLFGVPKDAYFARIEEALDRIIRALPAMKRIFAKPIVRLKDVSEIVPAEMARIINSHTLAHALCVNIQNPGRGFIKLHLVPPAFRNKPLQLVKTGNLLRGAGKHTL